MWKRLVCGAALFLAGIFCGALLVGHLQWSRQTREILRVLENGRENTASGRFSSHQLEGMPGPVARYLCAVLREGQPLVAAATAEQTGSLNLGGDGSAWRPFHAVQRVVTRRPGFLWDAQVRMMPGCAVRVRDAYLAGEGILLAKLWSVLPLADSSGSGQIAEGELMRFLAEAAWYPTVLLPGEGVTWEAVDDRSARARITDGVVSASLLFRFDERDLIESVFAESRGRMEGGRFVRTPWEGRWGSYQWREGMRTPQEGEVAWLLPQGRSPYWRGRITSIRYEFGR